MSIWIWALFMYWFNREPVIQPSPDPGRIMALWGVR
jgi:hypothetical protein